MNHSKTEKGFPKQEDINTLLFGFEFNYPIAFELKKAGIPLRLSGFGSWDPDQEKVQFQLIMLGGNPKTFTYKSTLLYKPSTGNQITVNFDDANLITGVPHGTKCSLSIQIIPIASAPKGFLELDFCEILRKGTPQESVAFLNKYLAEDSKRKSFLSISLFHQMPQLDYIFKEGTTEQKVAAWPSFKERIFRYLFKEGTTEQKFAAAHFLGNIGADWGIGALEKLSSDQDAPGELTFDQPAKNQNPIYEFSFPLAMAAAGKDDSDWVYGQKESFDGCYGKVEASIDFFTPNNSRWLKISTSVKFPEEMVAIFLGDEIKVPGFFVALENKEGRICLNHLLVLKLVDINFLVNPKFQLRPFGIEEMGSSRLRDNMYASYNAVTQQRHPAFDRYLGLNK